MTPAARPGIAMLGTALLLAGAACSLGQPSAPGFKLTSAAAGNVEQEILVTIPIDGEIEQVAADLAQDYGVELVAEWPISTLGVHCFVFRVSENQAVAERIDALAEDNRVVAAQPMQSFETLGRPYDDRLVTLQHGPSTLDAFGAHKLATGKTVSVALIDTGVDTSHPDLEGRVVNSRDFIDDGADGHDEIHGTALAGVIGASANNGIGIVGIAPEATITSLRGCWQESSSRAGRCTTFTLARALNVAVTEGFDVINMSLQGAHDPLLAEIIEVGLAQGQIFVAASDPTRSGDFPASIDGVLSVAADGDDAISPMLYAPGVDIITTVPGGRYDYLSGSSLASAHIAGVAALLLEHRKSLTGKEIQAILTDARLAEGEGIDACLAVREIVGGEGCA
ncbi:MAG: S8 family serine peptidase [Pseudomonadota bacterium]